MQAEKSKRIRRFKAELINDLPFFPHNRETKQELESQSLSSLLFHYLHWSFRKVPARRRKVIIAPEVTADHRWKKLSHNINALLKKASEGENLLPHLSANTLKKGYTSNNRIKNGEIDKWEDKDFILNTKGFHHFHLDMNIEKNGIAKRTKDVLFALIQRDSFHAIAIFDHSVFSKPNDGVTSSELERMWRIHEKHATLGMEPGVAYVSNPITMSGHPLIIHNITSQYSHAIYTLDPKLEEIRFLDDLYKQGNLLRPKNLKLKWTLYQMDLMLYDEASNFFIKIKDWLI